MAAALTGHVTSVGIQDVKGIVIHIRHGPLPFQMMLLSTHTHFPYRSWRFPHQDQKHSPSDLGGLEMFFRQIMLPLAPRQSITGTPLALAQPRMRRLNRPAKRIRCVLSKVSTVPVKLCHQMRNPPALCPGRK